MVCCVHTTNGAHPDPDPVHSTHSTQPVYYYAHVVCVCVNIYIYVYNIKYAVAVGALRTTYTYPHHITHHTSYRHGHATRNLQHKYKYTHRSHTKFNTVWQSLPAQRQHTAHAATPYK